MLKGRHEGAKARSMAAVLCICLTTQIFGAPDDQFILGYSTAILEQHLKVKAASLQVKDGVIVISAEDLPATHSDQIVKLLQDIPGVVRVDVIDGDVTPPSHRCRRAALSRPRPPQSAKPLLQAGSSCHPDGCLIR